MTVRNDLLTQISRRISVGLVLACPIGSSASGGVLEGCLDPVPADTEVFQRGVWVAVTDSAVVVYEVDEVNEQVQFHLYPKADLPQLNRVKTVVYATSEFASGLPAFRMFAEGDDIYLPDREFQADRVFRQVWSVSDLTEPEYLREVESTALFRWLYQGIGYDQYVDNDSLDIFGLNLRQSGRATDAVFFKGNVIADNLSIGFSDGRVFYRDFDSSYKLVGRYLPDEFPGVPSEVDSVVYRPGPQKRLQTFIVNDDSVLVNTANFGEPYLPEGIRLLRLNGSVTPDDLGPLESTRISFYSLSPDVSEIRNGIGYFVNREFDGAAVYSVAGMDAGSLLVDIEIAENMWQVRGSGSTVLTVYHTGGYYSGSAVLSTYDIGECVDCPADFARPWRTLDLADISVFATAFTGGNPIADMNTDGVFDLGDIAEFVGSFTAGCGQP